MKGPDYQKIYFDYIQSKSPEKMKQCEFFFQKKKVTSLDVIKINTIIFGYEKDSLKNRSFSALDITYILAYQKKKKLNNKQLAVHFKLSRNTVAKWKKIFII
ncbi:helix-turn-helix domain-containing protein [Chryseobacterium arthrosphaerae]|uniref:helix-turn-helix domain-containing protein n=1 Tax=Chryseobacterium arthrosphaerae TaxID=651561 RepID=UPI000F5135AF|nr:helix-turn-helix domain-containing protein [Chryseobacterium arthrosphaerae]AYZ12777.1 helix-turn-helix domain-containing protein [Chryseobacterium arthrosphaerae]